MLPASSSSIAKVRILVADSSPNRSELMVSALRRRADFEVFSCGLDFDAVLSSVETSRIQCVLLHADSRDALREMTVIRRLNLAHREVAAILLLDAYDRELVVNAFRSGVRGLFSFSEHPFRLLCKCIHCVHRGQIWANSEQLEYMFEVVTHVPSLRVVNSRGLKLLTPREEQVVALVADGLSNREVALELNLSEHTIKKYLFHIFDKLGISSRVELVLYAVSHGEKRSAEWVAGGFSSS
jgi:DNA-binding NarL/FixJ family response regulator